ncbi:hypothetical protein F4803DRAFT_528417 [Xylaria telfairii]|nr:hypothetical protein F4803DRAFT_528417 [Xylaria telfairii]
MHLARKEVLLWVMLLQTETKLWWTLAHAVIWPRPTCNVHYAVKWNRGYACCAMGPRLIYYSNAGRRKQGV